MRPAGTIPIASDTIRVADEGGESEVVFDLLADYPTLPYWTCPHMDLGERLEGVHEWSHTNALVPTDDGGWLWMARYLDALVALDADFDFRWQLGGRGATLDAGPEPLFRHGHTSEARGDRLLVSDKTAGTTGSNPRRGSWRSRSTPSRAARARCGPTRSPTARAPRSSATPSGCRTATR